MKKSIKLCLILSIIMIFTIGFLSNTYATISAEVNLNTSENNYKKGERIVVEVNLSNLESDKGIIITGAKLEFDANQLEIDSNNIEGGNGWTPPYYNEASRKLVMDRNKDFQVDDGKIMQIPFIVKTDKEEVANVSLKNVEVADGNQEKVLGDSTISLNLNKNGEKPVDPEKPVNPTEPTDPENPGDSGNNNGGTNTGNDTNPDSNGSSSGNKNTDVPKTGANLYFVYIIVGILIIGGVCLAVFFVNRKNLKNSLDK